MTKKDLFSKIYKIFFCLFKVPTEHCGLDFHLLPQEREAQPISFMITFAGQREIYLPFKDKYNPEWQLMQKTAHRMQEDICKQRNQVGINLQNKLKTYATQYKKKKNNKQPNQKMGRRTK